MKTVAHNLTRIALSACLVCMFAGSACLKEKSFGLDSNSPDLIGFSLGSLVLGASSIVFSSDTPAVSESDTGTTSVYTVRLNSRPTADVTLALSAADASISLDQSSLTFTPENWNTTQTVTVSAVDDTAKNGTTVTITHTASSSDSTYASVTATKSVSRSGDNEKYLFVTASTYTGNLGGIGGADSKCNADSARPSTSVTYKALISDVSNRQICTSPNCSPGYSPLDWSALANTTYLRDGVIVMQTNANGIHPLNLTNSFGSSAAELWTGLSGGWTSASLHCLAWSNGTVAQNGQAGIANATNTNALNNGVFSCDEPKALICVEQ